MNDVVFWKLDTLSDRQLLEGLGAVLGSGRRLTAELVAHLGEVEDRRLHLEAACSSMFSYCVNRLGLSEDEACRRIEVARLARRHPSMFPLLASGRLSLSVAALLKPHLSAEKPLDRLDALNRLEPLDPLDPLNGLDPVNPLDLLSAVSGKSVQQARELLAARFPRPDVPSGVRKLPVRRTAQPLGDSLRGAGQSAPGPAPAGAAALSTAKPLSSAPSATAVAAATQSVVQPSTTVGGSRMTPVTETRLDANDGTTSTLQPSASRSPTSRSRANRIEPLAAQRYKVQFTADTELKGKLELARDLMRHAHPSGEFGLIIGQALDLLIETLMKRRFGAGARRKAPSTATPPVASNTSGITVLTDTAALSDTAAPFATAVPSETAKPSGSVAPCDTALPSGPALSDAPQPSCPATPSVTKRSSDAENARDGAGATGTTSGKAGTTPSENGKAGTTPSENDNARTTPSENGNARTTPSENGNAGTTPSENDDARTPSDVPLRASQAAKSRYVRRAARRSVLERDGLRCSWVDASGARCEGRAWLEHDHRQPLGKGGDSEPDNVRLLCRAHNCLAAEREYGRQYMQRAVAQKRWERAQPSQRPPPR